MTTEVKQEFYRPILTELVKNRGDWWFRNEIQLIDSDYNEQNARKFTDYYDFFESDKEDEQEREKENQKMRDKLLELKVYMILADSEIWYFRYNCQKLVKSALSDFKYEQKEKARTKAKEYRETREIEKFRAILLDFYADRITYERAKSDLRGGYGSAYDCECWKTLDKMARLKETKSHTIQKANKLIDNDILRGYWSSVLLSRDESQAVYSIEKSHGFGGF